MFRATVYELLPGLAAEGLEVFRVSSIFPSYRLRRDVRIYITSRRLSKRTLGTLRRMALADSAVVVIAATDPKNYEALSLLPPGIH